MIRIVGVIFMCDGCNQTEEILGKDMEVPQKCNKCGKGVQEI